ncbi:hypothetical protein Lal_00014861 [Lupinus albus]|nr:hypothetical protein Lal_00014861 [Lupinus albus]
MLHLEGLAAGPDYEEQERVAVTVAEQLALALGNARLRESLRRQSVLDPLTGLFNRRHFDAALKRELARARRKNVPVSLVLVDIDHFKRVNDDYGHAVGDAVLRTIAQQLRLGIREGDIACRYGGEEMVLLLPECAAPDAGKRAEAIRIALAAIAPHPEGEGPQRVTASFGVAAYPAHAQDGEALFWAADKALYRAKQQGRNQVEALHGRHTCHRNRPGPDRAVRPPRPEVVPAPVRIQSFQGQDRGTAAHPARAGPGHGPRRSGAQRRAGAGAGARAGRGAARGRRAGPGGARVPRGVAGDGGETGDGAAHPRAARERGAHRAGVRGYGARHPRHRPQPVLAARRDGTRGREADRPDHGFDPVRARAGDQPDGRQAGRRGNLRPRPQRHDAVDDDRARHQAAARRGRPARHGRAVPRRRHAQHPGQGAEQARCVQPCGAGSRRDALRRRLRDRPQAGPRGAGAGRHPRPPRNVRRHRLSAPPAGGGDRRPRPHRGDREPLR